MRITETFRNEDYFAVDSDDIKIENKAYLDPVATGTYRIKWLFTTTVSELSDFLFDGEAVSGVTYKFKLYKNGLCIGTPAEPGSQRPRPITERPTLIQKFRQISLRS